MKESLIGGLLLVVLFNLFFFNASLGAGAVLFFLCLNLFFYWVRNSRLKDLTLGVVFSGLSIIFSLLIGLRASEITIAINFLLAVGFSLVALYFYKVVELKDLTTLVFLAIPLRVLAGVLKVVSGEAVERETKGKGESTSAQGSVYNYSSLSRGFLLAIPIVGILFLLLTAADPIFSTLAGKVLSNISQRLVISLVLLGAFLLLGLSKITEHQESKSLDVRASVTEILMVASSMVVLFALFLIVQIRYLFASVGELDLRSLGISVTTYSEYVRQGFFELLAVVMISLVVVIFSLKFLHRLNKSQKVKLQMALGFLGLEIFLLLVSDAKRLSLYELAHGFTRARILGLVLLIWLTFTLIIALWRIFKEVGDRQLFYMSFIISLAALLSLSVVNIDDLVATKFPPTVNNEVDYVYLSNLSNDAYQSWVPMVNDISTTLSYLLQKKDYNTEDYRQLYYRKETLMNLNNHINYLKANYGKSVTWQSFNLCDFMAYYYVNKNRATFDQLSNLTSLADKIDNNIPGEFNQYIYFDRNMNAPLTK